tara:strand:- start:149 stop:457 length:309 start_codon:yes stop_codon:yes gene_type:complete
MVTTAPETSLSQNYTSFSEMDSTQPLTFKVGREEILTDYLGKSVINNFRQDTTDPQNLESFVTSYTNNSNSGKPKPPTASSTRQQKHHRTIMDLFKCCFKGL